MEGADAARALAIAADEIICAIRLGCVLFASSPPCGQWGNGERFTWGGSVRVPMSQASPRVLAWFSLVQASPHGWTHPSGWLHLVELL